MLRLASSLANATVVAVATTAVANVGVVAAAAAAAATAAATAAAAAVAVAAAAAAAAADAAAADAIVVAVVVAAVRLHVMTSLRAFAECVLVELAGANVQQRSADETWAGLAVLALIATSAAAFPSMDAISAVLRAMPAC